MQDAAEEARAETQHVAVVATERIALVAVVVVKSVGFLSVPTLEKSKTVKFELPSHYPFVAFIGSSEGTRTQTVGKDENLELEMDAGESLFVFFNLKE